MATQVARLEAVLSARTDDFDRRMDRSESKMQKVGKTAGVVGLAIGAGLAVGAKKSIDAASDLNESVNAVNVVFGKASGQILRFSKIAAGEAGLSMRDFNQLVTPIGAALQNTGLGADAAAKASINLAKRAADMASVFNVDVKDALGAIQAGLRGEADPLERFGVNLSAAAVQSKALTLGLAGTAAELTANDKAQARLALVMDQTKRVAGDFKNTSGELANAQRINAAASENQRASLGQGLLPVMKVYQGLLSTVTQFTVEHTTATKVIIGVVAGLAVGLIAVNVAVKAYQAGVVAATAVQWLWNAALSANPIGLVVIALAALGVAIVVAYNKSETFRDIVDGLWDKLKSVAGFMRENFPAAKKAFLTAVNPIVDAFQLWASAIGKAVDGIQWLIDNIKKIPKPSLPSLPDLNPFGDAHDPSKGIGFDLMGASPVMAPFAAAAADFGLRVTSGLRPGAITANGTLSDHAVGKALDVAGSANAMAAFFRSLIGNRSVKQAFYDPLGSIFAGLWNSYREGGHSDHVHVATYDKGGYLQPGWNLAYNGLGRPEPVGGAGGITVNQYIAGSLIHESQVDDRIIEAIQKTRNLGRPI